VSLDERVQIEKGLDRHESVRVIAARLGRSPSTISREVRRNSWRPSNTSAAYRPVKLYWCRKGWLTDRDYRASVAMVTAARRGVNSHRPVVFASDAMVEYVTDRLRSGWTPAMIAGRTAARLPGGAPRPVSHETIYQWIYCPAQRGRGLAGYLPRGHTTRRHHHGRRVHSSHIPYRVSISARPDEANDRTQFGHWEGDTVEGRAHADGIHTEVERHTRFLAARKIDSITSQATLDAQRSIFGPLPPEAARSVTLDNGHENHLSYMLDEDAIPVYHAHPYSSWERGSNEHVNGLIRRYLPKDTNLTGIDQHGLNDIVADINNHPLKCLGWLTPAEAFTQQIESLPSVTVALQN